MFNLKRNSIVNFINIYKKYILTLISTIIFFIFSFIIYKSYKISNTNINDLPVINSDVEVIKIKKDNRELVEDKDIRIFYKDEKIDKEDFKDKELKKDFSDIEEENKNLNEEYDEKIDLDNLVYDIEKEEYIEKSVEPIGNIKKLIVNEKQEDLFDYEEIEDITKELTEDKVFKVQLVALKNSQQAQNFVEQTKKTYDNILKNLDIFVVKIDLKEKGIFYRVQVGNFKDREEALKFCNDYLKVENKNLTNCIIIK